MVMSATGKYTTVFTIAITVWLSLSPTAIWSQSRPASLRGSVKDQNGDYIVGAKIVLSDGQDATYKTLSDARGNFQFNGVKPASYRLRAVAEGFAEHEEYVELNSESSSRPVAVTLSPIISDSIVVTGESSSVGLDSQNAGGSQVLKEKEIQMLPDDPDQLREQLQLLAASSGSAPDQATVTVDGFSSGRRLPPKSSIREVRINPDIFSAEFDKAPYQGGRIEIYTKPGANIFNGSAFFNYNNSVFNARDAFAPSRLPSSTYRYGFQFGGPVVRGKSGFLLDFEARRIDDLEAVNAFILDKDFQPAHFSSSVLTPKRLLIGSGRIDWQANQSNTFVLRYDFNSNRLNNQGVGGFNLEERAFNSEESEHSVRFSQTSVFSSSLFNEARVGISRTRLFKHAASGAPAIQVLGAFASGGASIQSGDQNEWQVEVADNLSFIHSKHNLKFGAQIYGKYLNETQAENFNGTFIFGGGLAPALDSKGKPVEGHGGPVLVNISGLEQYRRALLGLPGGNPTKFFITTGNPNTTVSQWRIAGFAQDEWRPRPNFSLSLGLRYEAQTTPSDTLSLAPRIGVAYSPDKERNWVLRARAGIFYERISELLSLEAERLDGIHQQQIILDSPSFPDPFDGEALDGAVPTVRRLVDRLRPPASLQLKLGFERQFMRDWKLALNYSLSRGTGLLLSRNINAPLLDGVVDPRFAPRPLGVKENILQFESSGSSDGQVLFVGLNQNRNRFFSINAGYLFFDFRTNTDGPFTLPQFSYDLSAEWARPASQTRHRVFLIGWFNLPYKVRTGLTVNAASGTPFNITTGRDNNFDGVLSDRPSAVDPAHPNAILTRLGGVARLYQHCERASKELEPLFKSHCAETEAKTGTGNPPPTLWLRAIDSTHKLTYCSAAMYKLVEMVERVASLDVPVLITGETGVGKELIARLVHLRSPRSRGPLVPFNCAAVSRELFESQLFGYKQGAFTGAARDQEGIIRMAAGGTLLLDEVGELPLDFQPKLLRFLQEGEIHPVGAGRPSKVDVRVIASTNRNLEEETKAGRFRADLLYRLNVMRLNVPPQRERREDIPLLIDFFIDKHAQLPNCRRVEFTPEAMNHLTDYDWPGNVRELSTLALQLMTLSDGGGRISVSDLRQFTDRWRQQTNEGQADKLSLYEIINSPNVPLTQATDTLERIKVYEALTRHNWNFARAAHELGLSTFGLRKKYSRLFSNGNGAALNGIKHIGNPLLCSHT
ncbi:MAG TPA: TonB-dependent receptor, partial [Blastocatellia bacterium]|nr:TonB-dependent receptor [Blastocatellia bacterium]